MENQEISTFEKGKYNDTVREVYAALLSANVGVKNVEHIVRTVLNKLGGANSPKLLNISFIIVRKESAVPCTNSEIPTLYCPELVPICRPPYSRPFRFVPSV
jgi:hypothetical protein